MKKARKTTRQKAPKKNSCSVAKKKATKSKKKHVVKLRGKKYKIQKTGKVGSDLWGYCTDPKFTNRLIKIHKMLENDEELEILIHEMLHACFWDLDEEVVSEVGRDLSKALWKMGYRKQK
jgi:hypothetical protein